MPFDRSKYRASNFDAIKKEEEKQQQTDKKFVDYGDRKAGFFNIADGKNQVHVLPAHSPEDPAYVSIRTAMLKVLDDEWVDGEKTGKKVLRNKKIFIATQHCDAVREAGLQDPIEFYIQKVFEKAEEFQDNEDKKKFLFPIQGGGSGKNWVPGCIPSSTWVCYVQDIKRDLYRLELRNNWFTQLQKKSMELAEESDKVSLDMFSSPDDGFPLIITKGKKEVKGKEQVYYEIDAAKPKMGQSWEAFFEQNRITDEELQRLEKQPSLKELYVNCYTTRDLELAISGLKNLENAHPEFGVLETPEFESLIEKLYAIVPAPKADEKNEDALESSLKKENSNEVTPLKMKKYLREYIAENYGEEYSLPTDLTKDELKAWYKLAMEGEELPFEADDDTPSYDEGEGESGDEESEGESAAEEEKDHVVAHNPASIREALRKMVKK